MTNCERGMILYMIFSDMMDKFADCPHDQWEGDCVDHACIGGKVTLCYRQEILDSQRQIVNYNEGIYFLRDMLGFEYAWEMTNWIRQSGHWKNAHGGRVFSPTDIAYDRCDPIARPYIQDWLDFSVRLMDEEVHNCRY